jgi:hypothetical protein
MFPAGKEQHPGNYDKGVLSIRIVCAVKRHQQLAGKPSAASQSNASWTCGAVIVAHCRRNRSCRGPPE